MVLNRGPELAGVLGLFLALSWIFVSLRAYVKIFMTKSWAVDDILLGISLIFFSTYSACSLMGIKYGTGRRIPDIPEEDIPKALYYWWLCELFYTITTVFIRLSIAVFLLRICIKPIHKYIIHGTLLMVITFSTFYLFLVIFQCSQVNFFWDQYRGANGSCINPAAVPDASIAHSAVSFTADWILGLLPIAMLWHLQMNTRTKVSVAAILAMGLLAGIATLIRVPYIKVLALTDNFLFATTDVAIWSTVEPGLGIVAAAAATLRPLFRTFYSLTSRGTNQKSNHYPSRLRNSRGGYIKHNTVPDNHEVRPHTAKSSVSTISGGDYELRTDTMVTGGVFTTARSPFGDSIEDMVAEHEFTNAGGIKVHRTVEISRAAESDSVSGINEPWPIHNKRSDKDMV